MSNPTPNDDEQIQTQIGNFHKSLPHGPNGVVDANEYQKFRTACVALEAGLPVDFEHIRAGKPQPDHEPAMFTNPLAGAATEQHGPDPKDLEMPPAPGILSASSAAELIELYWMALLRDVPLADLNNYPDAGTAVSELTDAFHNALNADRSAGGLKLHGDLPHDPTGLDLRVETLFGCGLLGEDKGPRISQFFLQDIPYGVQRISPKQRPYASGENFLTTYASWFYTQDTGLDYFGRDYAQCNHYADELTGKVKYYATQARCISTLRDLARFVNRDALHQAYFNAALFLDAIGAPLDGGNPYVGAAAAKKRRECSCIDGGDDAQDMRDCPCLQDVCGARYKREGGFATLGGPDLLTLVSEVASRALKVVWRQNGWCIAAAARKL